MRKGLAGWRRPRVRALVVPIVLCFAGYVFTWGDVEQDSRAAAIFVGGFTFGLFVFVPGFLWWGFRHVIGRPRPFGRAVFNYGLVGFVALLGIALADEFLG